MEEELKGYFWMPNKPELKHFGEVILSTSQKKNEVIIYGSFPEFDRLHYNINFHDDIPYLYGYTRDKKFITLLGLRITGASLSPNPPESSAFKSEHKLSFSQFICGPIQFPFNFSINRISVTAQFMEAWGIPNPIEMEVKTSDNSDESPSKSYNLKPGKPISIPFEPDTCTFYDYLSHSHKFQINHLELKQRNCLSFTFQRNLEISELYIFLEKFREFYTLITGVNLGLDLIVIYNHKVDGVEYQYEFDRNISNNSYSFIAANNRILGIKELSSSVSLKYFFKEYNTFSLPLAHYMGYLNSDRSNYVTFIQPFISALEIIYNKCYREQEKNAKNINPTLEEILKTYKLSGKHKQFLVDSKLAKTYRDLHLKDKLIALINVSDKLTELVADPIAFTKRILDLRHYLVHEVEKDASDLTLLNNRLLLGKHIVKLKVILEYHLLLMMGLDKEIVEKRIGRTLPNFVHFDRY